MTITSNLSWIQLRLLGLRDINPYTFQRMARTGEAPLVKVGDCGEWAVWGRPHCVKFRSAAVEAERERLAATAGGRNKSFESFRSEIAMNGVWLDPGVGK